jgi:hypothetical protein
MAMLADLVDVVIGVDTHKHTHTLAIVTAATGAVVNQATVAATTAGYQQLLALATQQPGQRIWAIESTAGYGAGLTRFLHASAEQVVELDRPKRAARRHGAKSDPLDATRAAREALGREHLAQPRAAGHRAALQVQLTARRSAVQATGDAQRQLHALVTAAQNPSAVASPTWPPPAGHRLPAATPTHQLGHRNHRHRGQPARPGPPHPAPGHRDRPAHPGHHHPGPGLATRAAHPNWRGPDRGRISAVRLVPCWPLPLRRRLRDARRSCAHPRFQRPDHALSAQPVRGPPAQPGPTRRRHDQTTNRPSNPRLRPAATRPGQDQPRDQTLPGPLRRPPALPTPRDPSSP